MNKRMDFLKSILCIDSTNGGEEAVADCIKAFLETEGIESFKVPYSPGRSNLVAQIGEGEKTLGISGHLDVVSAGDASLWTSPPFTPTERKGKLFARGATDMKGGLAALIMAMVELKQENTPFDGVIKLLATVGEEVGLLGAKQLTDQGYANGLNGLIIAEPTTFQIIYAHKGIYTYTVTSYGKSAHSSMSELGINAIDHLLVFYNEVNHAFNQIKQRNDALGDFVVCNSLINGGDQINNVPSIAKLTANIRTIPEFSNEQVTDLLTSIVKQLNASHKDMRLELEIKQSNLPVFSKIDSPLVQIAKSQGESLLGAKIQLLGMPGGADSAEFIRANKDMDVIIWGPGNQTLHQIDEYIEIEHYHTMIDLYKKVFVEYLK